MPAPASQLAAWSDPGVGAERGGAHDRSRVPLLCLAVLPAALVAVVAAAFLVPVAHGRAAVPNGWLAVGAALTGVVLAGAVCVAVGEERARARRLAAVRRQAARARVELRALLRKVERGERVRHPGRPPAVDPAGDSLERLSHEVAATRHTAELAVAEAVALARGIADGGEEATEVFVHLARRVQSLVHRQVEHLDELASEVASALDDQELLRGLGAVDQLATRVRRQAENLVVLGGAVSRRQWARPVGLAEVLGSAVAEVEGRARVRVVPHVTASVRGHAVADVVHLLAELVENATAFSAPQTHVLLRAEPVAAGVAVEVEDRGLGMTAAELSRMNAVLSGAEPPDAGELLQDGRVGLFVVSTLARRHHLAVQLQNNIYGGVQAVVVLPQELLDAAPAAEGAEPGARGADADATLLPPPRGHRPRSLNPSLPLRPPSR